MIVQRALIKLFEYKYARDYMAEHLKEFQSTSPFAITSEKPIRRIVEIPITRGGSGFYKGTWSIDTIVKHEIIFTCPVTDNEFKDDELSNHREKILSAAKRYGVEKAQEIEWRIDFDTEAYKARVEDKVILITRERLENFADGDIDAAINYINNELKR